MKKIILIACLAGWVSSANAQDGVIDTVAEGGGTGTISQLLSQGFEIKASVPNGAKFIVFLQKDKEAYACEFASLATSQCGAIK
jgi:hypothetical protein